MPAHKDTNDRGEALHRSGTLHPHPGQVTDERFQHNPFFDARDIVQVKYEMLRRVAHERWSITRAAKQFGFSRPTFYQAQAAFRTDGLYGLVPQRRGPRQAHKLSDEILDYVEALRAENPALRMPQVVSLVAQRFDVVVHRRSIERRLQGRKKKKP